MIISIIQAIWLGVMRKDTFWFVGRADDVIKSSGYRIGPFEVESAFNDASSGR